MPLVSILRMRWLTWSVTYKLPAESKEAAVGLFISAATAGPLSPEKPWVLATPAKVVMTPLVFTLRMSWAF